MLRTCFEKSVKNIFCQLIADMSKCLTHLWLRGAEQLDSDTIAVLTENATKLTTISLFPLPSLQRFEIIANPQMLSRQHRHSNENTEIPPTA